MKYPTLLLMVGFGLTLAAACQGRGRMSAGPGPRRDSATLTPDGGVPEEAAGDAVGDTAPGRGDGGGDDGALPDSGPPADSGPAPDSAIAPHDAGSPTCAPSAGSLVIVEVMIASQGGTDLGEWFEIVNAGACTVDLRDLEIGSPTTEGAPVTHTVSAGTLSPGDHYVFALSGDPLENHDLPWDYVYGTGTRSDVFVGNAGDALTLAYRGLELDRVVWAAEDYLRGAALQYPLGAALSANDDITRWCDARRVYSTGFLGSPGAPNDSCP